MSACLRAIIAAAIVAIAAAAAFNEAQALSARSLYGKWCTAGGSEEFDDNYLTAIPRSGERHRFRISEYEVVRNTVTVYWTNGKGERVSTDFGEFSTDGKRMVQMRNESGPRREFRRCG